MGGHGAIGYCPMVCATPISVMGSITGQFSLGNGALLIVATMQGKVHWPTEKNSGNDNGVSRSLGAHSHVSIQ